MQSIEECDLSWCWVMKVISAVWEFLNLTPRQIYIYYSSSYALAAGWLHTGQKTKYVTDVTDSGDGSNVVMVNKKIQTVAGSSSRRSVPSTTQQQQMSVNKSLTHTETSRQLMNTEMSTLCGRYCSFFAIVASFFWILVVKNCALHELCFFKE